MKHLNYRQIRALIKKDILVRLRQPWMTFLSFFWPCMVFMSLYILRLRFKPHQIGDCQFPTRQLPTNDLLPFFQSYICTIENQCSSVHEYEEVVDWQKAPATPVLNIVQTFLNEKDLYKAIVDLPKTMDFVSLVTKLATHPKFKYIESNADYLVRNLPQIRKTIGNFFDVNKLFSNDRIFSNLGKILCNKPFPRSNNIRYVDNVLYSPDYAGPDKDELEVMPTPYCKQLYLDVTNSNNGKITWKILKPIIQGKILYGPVTDETMEIMSYANHTMNDMSRLRSFFRSLETTIKMLKTNKEFRAKFDGLLNLAKTPFIQAILGGKVDIQTIEMVIDSVINEDQVLLVIETIGNIFDCYNVDRFIPVNSEKELEDAAFNLAKKKLFYAAVFFTNDKKTNETTYKLRMEVDNTPVTIENRNRFYFPGPEASFELEMRYHRGFIEIQNSIDVGIIKAKKKKLIEANRPRISSKTTTSAPDDLDFSDNDFDFDDDKEEEKNKQQQHDTTTEDPDFEGLSFDDLENTSSETTTKAVTSSTTAAPPINIAELLSAFVSGASSASPKNNSANDDFDFDNENFWNFDDGESTTTKASTTRKRRQLEGLLSMFGAKSDASKLNPNEEIKFDIDEMRFFTKQFPYPKHTRDDFKKGLYLAQAIQMTFFFALIILISSSVRQKIWFKESGNLSLMRTMGLNESSETVSWIVTTFFELAIVFFFICVILYTGGIMQYSSKLLIYIYLLFFGFCVISFCFMASSFFSTASIGSVSTVILFLMTFLPYIIIISLGAVLGSFGKFIASLSFSTAFCYAWHYIFRIELQERSLTLFNAFSGDDENDFRFGLLMIILDTFLYAAIGMFYKKYSSDDLKFVNVERRNIDKDHGAEMKKVTKVYEGCDPSKPAVDNVSLTFKKNQIVCILGRNGAGKSSVIKLLTGQIAPTLGEIILPLDYDLITGFKNDNEQVGLCPQNNVLIPNLTAKEHLEMYAHIKLRKEHRREIRRVMNNMKLGKYKDYKVSELSGGYKRRLCIAIAFLGSPNLVILDEPCSSVDISARKVIWDLIETLRKNRAVVMSTHDLEEAQHLGDQIIMMKDGRIALEATTKDLHNELTRNFNIVIDLKASISKDKESIDEIKEIVNRSCKGENNIHVRDCSMNINMPYFDEEHKRIDYGDLFRDLERLVTDKKIIDFHVLSKTLESYYKNVEEGGNINGHSVTNGNHNNNNNLETIDLKQSIKLNGNFNNGSNGSNSSFKDENKLSLRKMISNLFLKRFLHFKRNYRLLICILILPVIFEIIAMGFLKIRPPGDYDNSIEFNRSMYPQSTEFYSQQNMLPFGKRVYNEFQSTCSINENCEFYNSSKDAFDWVLNTNEKYILKRYGGISINQSRSIVWYNNKGYHSMPLYLNILNSAILRNELNDSSYNIRTINHPLMLGENELSVSSILQQVADSGISLIILVAFSLVIAGGSVYIVNERVTGEKLQQQLCGVTYPIYWGVAFIWDFAVYAIAICLAVIVFQIFNIPIYVDINNLAGIVLLLFLFGFAMIPGVHLFEKAFKEASFANMSIFCLNVIMALSTVASIVMFDVLLETDEQQKIRNVLNRFYLIFPQHALADGLIEICKNYITAKIFSRYYIDTYKNPITSDLLRPHFLALIILGVVFIVLNYIIESGKIWTIFKTQTPKQNSTELKVITIQNTLTKDGKINGNGNSSDGNEELLKVENVYRSYGGNEFAVNNVSFTVKKGECYALIGSNGAGKSSLFSILSGETKRFIGAVKYRGDKNSVSYCPQSNALDSLLTVEEIIEFYGKLRNIDDIRFLVETTLENFHLKPYRRVLVKNLSGGNKRKLSVACASLGNLSLVLMDEPVADMDPLTRHLVYKTIRELNEENCSVILTSHSIAEIEDVCQSVGILVDGSMVASGTPERLKKDFGNRYVVTILSETPLDHQFEADLRKTFRSMKNSICHQYSAQFLIQVRDFDKIDHCHIKLSELIDLLNAFTSVKDLKYTITTCMIDQVYENIIKRGVLGVDNNGFVQNEYYAT
ncbi:hypothetical protein PVAND_012265 [Polypedilum vanderplanki]|uniref:ABC transporter domain-containing protein n=1 Tax=Polypedilum vanderplanki TaxID=319348 RepID=A0A9J6CLX1_POLVA|nr:hypothetical protein PVAND_012265 [Polypedilum vanderplanki]